MVLNVVKYDIHPDKAEAYAKLADSAIKRVLAVPGIVELRVYRGGVGASHQVLLTYEFADLAAWAAWDSHPDVQKLEAELYAVALNVTTELWGPSPVVPAPIRPGK
jgi:quinol monooxygenase YgiN